MSCLEGPNLILRPIEVADAPRVVELLQDPEVNRFFVSPPPLTLWEAEDYAETFAWETLRGDAYHFAIVIRARGEVAMPSGKAGSLPASGPPSRSDQWRGRVPWAGGEVAGVADLYHISRAQKQAEIGIWMGREFWGHGYAAEANRLLLKLAFEKLGLERVVYRIAHDNLRSQRAFEKMGARRVNACMVYSSRLDRDIEHWLYAITRREVASDQRPSKLEAPGSKLQASNLEPGAWSLEPGAERRP